jgi:hypothetical protein
MRIVPQAEAEIRRVIRDARDNTVGRIAKLLEERFKRGFSY